VTLYQQQRSAMRMRANAREGYIYQLARERVNMQAKLGELQSLVVTLLGERSMLHSYQTALSPAANHQTPPPPDATTKRHRRTRHAHSHNVAEADTGTSVQ